MALIRGTAGNDLLVGAARTDAIMGHRGDDRVEGLGGADRLFGGDGDDRLSGADGADLLQGGSGRDALLGGLGDDHLYGGRGRDVLDGGAGGDRLDAGDDRSAHHGSVLLDPGRVEVDVLRGGDGNDVLRGADLDFLLGGPGNDRIVFAPTGNYEEYNEGEPGEPDLPVAVVEGGPGYDVLYLDLSGATAFGSVPPPGTGTPGGRVDGEFQVSVENADGMDAPVAFVTGVEWVVVDGDGWFFGG